jgi:hypothetical protein
MIQLCLWNLNIDRKKMDSLKRQGGHTLTGLLFFLLFGCVKGKA